MENAAALAGYGRATPRRLLVRLSAIAVSVSVALALVVALLQREAEAQINFTQIVCPILINLGNAFGGFFAGIFQSLLAAFGCVISG